MHKYYPSLEEAIRKKIRVRIVICIVVLLSMLVLTAGFYFSYFFNQTEKKAKGIESNLTNYILSQELIGLNSSVQAEIARVSKLYKVSIEWHKGVKSQNPGFHIIDLVHWRKVVPVISLDGQDFGYYVMSGSIMSDTLVVASLYIQAFMMILFVAIIFFLLWPIAQSIPKTLFVVPISRLLKFLKSEDKPTTFDAPYEIVKLKDEVASILEKKAELTRKNELLKLARQVVHDIRSPLQTIITSLKVTKKLPEDYRGSVATASNRINDILNNLLTEYKAYETGVQENASSDGLAKEMIFPLIDSILSEKRFEYAESGVVIHFNHSDIGCQSFVRMERTKFKRAISNIINNSIDAMTDDGEIVVALDANEERVIVSIQDNGKGIEPSILSEIKKEGFSSGKEGGEGIGLSTADEYIRKMHGALDISSKAGEGTTVTITLPRTSPSSWFCSEICLEEGANVIVADDDRFIHEVLKMRVGESRSVNQIDIYTTKKLTDYLSGGIKKNDWFLIDYEFIGSDMNGLAIIHKYGISKKAYLVTNNFEDQKIKDAVKKYQVKMVPKPCVPYIKISFTKKSPETLFYVFIDDDKSLRSAWLLAAKCADVTLECFAGADECNASLADIPKDAIFYIDSDLGEGNMCGEAYAKELYSSGYKNLYLASGMDDASIDKCPWFKGIAPKSPPF